MMMPPKVQSSSFCTPKTTNPTTNDREFQTHELIVYKAKRIVVACMKESKKRIGGEEKHITFKNPEAYASLDDQGVNIKMNM
jgi:hypothetical protein